MSMSDPDVAQPIVAEPMGADGMPFGRYGFF